jgi:cytochrome b6-f complex iron-sulfur subunit
LIVVIAAGLLLVFAVAAGRPRAATGRLDGRARRSDRSALRWPASPPDRPSPPVAGTGRVGWVERFTDRDPAPAEQVGLSRRQFFNRSVLAAQVLGLAGFGSAVVAFLWPSLSGGFGAKVNAGPLLPIKASLNDKKEPFYVPEARSYLNPYPEANLPAARKVYSENILAGMELGLVALFQKCPHLGCRVPWCKTSQWFECPCHGSKYNRVGEKKGGPAPRGMDRFPLDLVGGNVVINTGIVVLGPPIGSNTTGQEAEGPHCV